jgi:hypothetical protein
VVAVSARVRTQTARHYRRLQRLREQHEQARLAFLASLEAEVSEGRSLAAIGRDLGLSRQRMSQLYADR